jgi:hypothetical protein
MTLRKSFEYLRAVIRSVVVLGFLEVVYTVVGSSSERSVINGRLRLGIGFPFFGRNSGCDEVHEQAGQNAGHNVDGKHDEADYRDIDFEVISYPGAETGELFVFLLEY